MVGKSYTNFVCPIYFRKFFRFSIVDITRTIYAFPFYLRFSWYLKKYMLPEQSFLVIRLS